MSHLGGGARGILPHQVRQASNDAAYEFVYHAITMLVYFALRPRPYPNRPSRLGAGSRVRIPPRTPPEPDAAHRASTPAEAGTGPSRREKLTARVKRQTGILCTSRQELHTTTTFTLYRVKPQKQAWNPKPTAQLRCEACTVMRVGGQPQRRLSQRHEPRTRQ